MLRELLEERRHNQREVQETLERIHEDREKERQRRNASIQRPSAGTRVVTSDLALSMEGDSSLHRQGMGPKLVHEKWTGPWKVAEVAFEGLGVVIEMGGWATRSRTVSAASLKPFYRRPSDVRHPMGSGPCARGVLDCSSTNIHAPEQEAGGQPDRGREMGVPRPVPRQGGVELGLRDGVNGQLQSAAVRHVSRVVELIGSEQRAEPPRSPRRGCEETPRAE